MLLKFIFFQAADPLTGSFTSVFLTGFPCSVRLTHRTKSQRPQKERRKRNNVSADEKRNIHEIWQKRNGGVPQ
jgi:hypothetical protein